MPYISALHGIANVWPWPNILLRLIAEQDTFLFSMIVTGFLWLPVECMHRPWAIGQSICYMLDAYNTPAAQAVQNGAREPPHSHHDSQHSQRMGFSRSSPPREIL